MKSSLFLPLAALILAFSCARGRANWVAGRDLAANESTVNETANPNLTVPAWRYGYRTTLASPSLTLFTPAMHVNSAVSYPGVDGFTFADNPFTPPDVLVNTAATPLVRAGMLNLNPLEMELHPGANGEYAIVRWTAPRASTFSVVASWQDINSSGGDGANGSIVKNGTTMLYSLAWANGGAGVSSNIASITLAVGDYLDFAVGMGANFFSDSTRFDATITDLNAPPPWTGPVMQPGIAVATCFSGAAFPSNDPDSNGYVMGQMDTNAVTVTGSANNPVPMYHNNPEWKRSRLGEVFGITLDDQTSPNAFVSATASYNSSFHPVIQYNQWPAVGVGDTFGTWAEPGGVYRIDGTTGSVCNYARVPNAGLATKGQTASLGNICYDKDRHVLFVSNLDDGGIYRIPWVTPCPPTPIVATKIFDHGTQGRPVGGITAAGKVVISDSATNGITAPGRRVWGLQSWNGRLYYGVWNEGTTSQAGSSHSEVWSVKLDQLGDPVLSSTKLEIRIIPQSYAPVTMPISDIAFTPSGVMMISERGCVVASAAVATANILPGMLNILYPHDTNIYQYRLTASGGWAQGNLFKVGNSYEGDNAAGGLDVDCDETVLAVGNALANVSIPLIGYFYGLQIIPQALNPSGNYSAPIANSHIIDYDGISSVLPKTTLGDIALMKRPCPCLMLGRQQMACKNGKQRWTVSLQNTSGFSISWAMIDNPTAGFTGPSTLTAITPPLLPGQYRTLSFDFTVPAAAATVEEFCFDLVVHNENLSTCCSTPVCVKPQTCICIEDEWFQKVKPQGLQYCVRLTNFSGKTATKAIFASTPVGSTCPLFRTPVVNFPPLAHGQSTTLCVPIIAPMTCTSLKFTISLLTEGGTSCCPAPLPRSHAWGYDPGTVINTDVLGGAATMSIKLDGLLAADFESIDNMGCMINGVASGEVVRPILGLAQYINLPVGNHRVAYFIQSSFGARFIGTETEVNVSPTGVVTVVPTVTPFQMDSFVRTEDNALILWWEHPDAVLQTSQDMLGPWENLAGQPSPYVRTNYSDDHRFFRIKKP